MKGNVFLVTLECSNYVVYRYKTDIRFLANKMDGYKPFLNYKSNFVIYLLECKTCPIQYVG